MGTQLTLKEAQPPNFSSHVYCGQTAGWIKMSLDTKVGLGPDHIVLDGNPAPPPPKGKSSPNFRPMSLMAKLLDGSRCHLVRRQASAQATLCCMGIQLLRIRSTAPSPNFRPTYIVAKWSPISATAEHLYNSLYYCISHDLML